MARVVYYACHMMTTTKTTAEAWRCQECGHTFRSAKAAEKAMLGANGCPKCGGFDIDLTPPAAKPAPVASHMAFDPRDLAFDSERIDRNSDD